MKVRMRSQSLDGSWIKLCKHIQISGYKVSEHDESEYVDIVAIKCKECHRRHIVTMLIN
jgi:hypothetical protein